VLLGYAVNHDYDCLVFMDGDGQHNPDEIPALVGPILSGTGRPRHRVPDLRPRWPIYRRFGRAVLDLVSSNGSSITDSQCGFRALSRKTHRYAMHDTLNKR